jgi:hypothetical protein
MSDSDDNDGDNAMFWFNLVGISVAVGLFGAFFWLYGADFFQLVISFFAPDPMLPPH